MKKHRKAVFVIVLSGGALLLSSCGSTFVENKEKGVLNAGDFKHHVDYFNRMEDENIAQTIPNAEAWEWMENNIPLFECPQDNFEEMYYFRWWSFRKHLVETPVGWGITEFLVKRPYADKYNLISCALGHHIMEARWLRNPEYMQSYVHTWLRGNDGQPMGKLFKFSSWTAYALLNSYYVNQDKEYLVDMLPDLMAEYAHWEAEKKTTEGLFWQYDVRDGMEEQISGGRKVKNYRPTINSYMYGNAKALTEIAKMKGDPKLQALFAAKADTLKHLLERLWDKEHLFYETMNEDGSSSKVREAIGYIPWYFNIPDASKSLAWKQITDSEGFSAPYGLTTAERRHPRFRSHGCCRCEWDGAIWPFASSQTLTGLANLLNNYEQNVVTDSVYFHQMELYVEAQYHRGRPYIGEYQDEVTGYWLKGDQERSRYYNHSTFNDLVITGLVGLRPHADNVIEVNPLIPHGKWAYFCLDKVMYHGKSLTIVWDETGEKYNKGKGLYVLVDGKEVAGRPELGKLQFEVF